MEEFKDVLLSEPPSRFTAAPAIQSMSLENYKGILLCDRPTATGKAAQGDAGPVPFLPAGKGDTSSYNGLQPSIESRGRYEMSRSMRQNNKVSKPSAMSRHKAWLYSFSNAVKRMQLDKAEQQIQADERERRLREKQNDQRLLKQQMLAAQPTAKGSAEEEENVQMAPAEVAVAPEELAPPVMPSQPKAAKNLPPKKKSTSKKSKPKPKWAMTEDEALDAELNENDHLVDFAEHLNFEKFVDDYEVREALAIMRDRVKEIADEQGIDLADVEREDARTGADVDDDDLSSMAGSEVPSNCSTAALEELRERRRARKAARAAKRLAEVEADSQADDGRPGWNKSTTVGDKLRGAISSDATALAEKMLAATPSLNSIYTKFTLGRMLQDAAMTNLKESTIQRRTEGAANVPVLPPVAPPVVTTVAAESLATGEQKQKRVLVDLKKKKDHVQNLPYMYRCPSL